MRVQCLTLMSKNVDSYPAIVSLPQRCELVFKEVTPSVSPTVIWKRWTVQFWRSAFDGRHFSLHRLRQRKSSQISSPRSSSTNSTNWASAVLQETTMEAFTKWLSKEAIKAKLERRRLGRIRKRSKSESELVAYRRACRSTNNLNNSSRGEHIRHDIYNWTDVRKRWSVIRKRLHSSGKDNYLTAAEEEKMSSSFSSLTEKIPKLNEAIRPGYSSHPRLLTAWLTPQWSFTYFTLSNYLMRFQCYFHPYISSHQIWTSFPQPSSNHVIQSSLNLLFII